MVALLVALVLGCLALPPTASGRAGGGGGYSSGGGGGGGGGYSSGGGSGGELELLFFLIELSIDYPLIGIPLIVALIVFLILRYRGHLAEAPASGPQRRSQGRVDAWQHEQLVEKIQRSDPEFDGAVFRENFERAFVEIQRAWQSQDMSPVQHFVTDGIYEKFSLQFNAQRTQGYRERLEQIDVQQARFADWVSQGVFDVLTVEVRASMVDYRVAAETGKWLSGSRRAESFLEYWSFIRRRDVQTKTARGSLLGGQCPNCGSEVELNQFSRCSACDAMLRSGSYDWVLSEITQASEWRARNPQRRAVSERYRRQHDPEFSLQQLEDRASVIFYRKAAADLAGSIDPLRKMATDGFCEQYQSELRAENRAVDVECAVGSVDCKGIVTDPNQHYAVVEVRWTSRLAAIAGRWTRVQSWLVLMRSAAAKRTAASTLQSSHCPACGAPEGDLTSDACAFCGEVTNTGLFDWVLVEFHRSRDSQGARDWKRRMKLAAKPAPAPVAAASAGETVSPSISASEGLAWMIRVLVEDGVLDATERDVVRQLARKNGIADQLVQQWLLESPRSDPLAFPTPGTEAARGWIGEVVGIALADGEVDDSERRMLKQLASSLGMSSYDVNLVIRKRQFQRTRSGKSSPA